MKHGFLIMAHTNWNQLKKLLQTLDDSRNSFYVHIDANARGFNSSQFNGLLQNASLHFIPRTKITWGGESQIKCELALIDAALKSNSDYYHLISGMDFPLHTMNYIDDFFKKNSGKEFIQFTENGELNTDTRNRIALYHPFQEKLGKSNRQVERILNSAQKILHVDRLKNNHILLGKGTNWFSISKQFAQYITDMWPAYKKIFSQSLCADEMFPQTIILNSPYKKNIYHPEADDNYKAIMRLIDWTRGRPYTFQTSDFSELINSPMLFARKFDEHVDQQIIDMLVVYLQMQQKQS